MCCLTGRPSVEKKKRIHSLHLFSPNDTACLSNLRGNDTNVFTAAPASRVSVGLG